MASFSPNQAETSSSVLEAAVLNMPPPPPLTLGASLPAGGAVLPWSRVVIWTERAPASTVHRWWLNRGACVGYVGSASR